MKRNKFLTLVPAVGVAFALLYTVSASPGHGYVSVAAGGFSPYDEGCDYVNFGGGVRPGGGAGSCQFYAPVQLPQGATVTKFTAVWTDTSSEGGSASLYRVSSLAVDQQAMATANTQGDSGFGTSIDIDIDYSLVDNSEYAYTLNWTLPNSQVTGINIVIEYSYPTGLPLILRNFQEAVRGR